MGRYSLLTSLDIDDRDAFASVYSSDGQLLCIGGVDGAVRMFHASQHSEYKRSSASLTSAACAGRALTSPCTSLNFRPCGAKNLLLVTASNGSVSQWHLGSSKMLHAMTVESEVYCSAYNPTGNSFVVAGKDAALRVYDDDSKVLKIALRDNAAGESAHSSRVQSVKFVDEHVIVSGGWDRTVQVWDVRTGRAERSIYGPYICGDGLDVFGDTIVTASTRGQDQLETWSLATGERIASVKWPREPRADLPTTMDYEPTDLFAAKFSPCGNYIAAGGSSDFRVFDASNPANVFVTGGELERGGGSERPIFGVSWAPHGGHVCVTGGKAHIVSGQS